MGEPLGCPQGQKYLPQGSCPHPPLDVSSTLAPLTIAGTRNAGVGRVL